jgi:hypothetical protein
MSGGSEQPERWHEKVATHIDRLRGPAGSERRQSALAVLERAATNPKAFASHLDASLAVIASEPPGARWAAAASIGHVATHHPGMIAPSADRLLELLEDEEATVREPISSALVAIVPEREIPTSPLLSTIERDDAPAAEAVDVAATVAATRPETLSSDRIEQLLGTNPAADACARYLLTILSATGPGVTAPNAPDPPGFEALATRLGDHFPTSRANQFLTQDLQRRAIEEFLSMSLEDTGYRGMDVTKTPMGTQLLVHVDVRPSRVDTAPSPDALAAKLESRFGLESPEIEIRATE